MFLIYFDTYMLESSILVILQCTCITASLPRLTINGEWSPWSKIKSECVRLNETDHVIQSGITCGGGVRFLERSCTNPKPQVSIRRKLTKHSSLIIIKQRLVTWIVFFFISREQGQKDAQVDQSRDFLVLRIHAT